MQVPTVLFVFAAILMLAAPPSGFAQAAPPDSADNASSASADRYTVETDQGTVEIQLDGKMIAKYWPTNGSKPILWPLIGLQGDEMTRGYPMREASETERADHVHHRSFWMTHGDVNGVDFWAEGEDCGKIVPVGDVKVSGGQTASLEAQHEWRDAEGNRLLSDRWQLTFDGDEKNRWIDCVFSLTASDGDVVFGDTKEGSFGIRVAGTMKVDAKQGGKLINSEGQTNVDAWGKRAAWVDYHGPVGDSVQGIAVLNHPSSYGHPLRWHVRTYGLFAANPFGERHFVGGDATEGKRLPAGETWKLAFRVVLHEGDQQAGQISEAWEQYSQQPLP